MWWGMMEGGGAMEGRGSDVGYWRGETHLGSLFPMSTCHFPCLHVGAHVCVSVPASACRCPCSCVVARVRTSLPVSACRCPRPFTFVGGRFRSWAWVVAFVGGRSSSFMGNGSVVVGGGESSGLALTCGGVAVVVVSWYQAVHVTVVASGASRGCRVVVWLPRRQLRRGTFGCCQ